MSITLALADAANNCTRDGATAVLTLRSGVQVEGKLERGSGAILDTVLLRTEGGGWATVAVDEIAVVESKR